MSSATVEVNIMGQSYVLACPQGEEDALRQAVAEVDREMCSIRDLGKIRARERIAVLAALNLAHAKLLSAGAAGTPPPTQRAETAIMPDIAAQIARINQRLDSALDTDGQLL
ncbi:MAG: cell division protein ZapA [Thiomonas sp. 15-66-11]|jgi:cell division protein ZapA|nr:MAG: cell division protein ZapA [Thiomonas sp. 15-66-11]